jgi:YD repeat-containing protein
MTRFLATHYLSSSRIFIFSMLFLFLSAANAQILNVGDDTSTPIEGAGHDYIKMLSETVNPSDGSVSVRIHVPVAKGRGITLPFAFAYDSNGVEHLNPGVGGVGWTSNNGVLAQGGWSYSLPTVASNLWSTTTTGPQNQTITCSFVSYYVFQDPSGGRHNLSGMGSAGWSQGAAPPYLCGPPVTSGGDPQYSASLLTAYGDGNVNPPVTVSDADGTVYTFASSAYTIGTLPSSIEDRNGNMITAGSGSVYYYDSVGRPAIQSSGFGPSGATNTLTISGEQYKAAWTNTSASYSVPTFLAITPPPGQDCISWPSVSATETVISAITLPNTQQYQFFYGTNPLHPAYNNPYGLLSEIDYPDGGWVRYTWTMNNTSEPAIYTSLGLCENGTCNSPQPNGCQFEYGTPVISTRTVGFATTTALTQAFSYNTAWSTANNYVHWLSKTTNVTTTDNIQSKSALTTYKYSSGGSANLSPYQGPGISASQIPLEQTIQYYDWGNTSSPIRTVNKTWLDQFDLSSEQTVLENGLSSKKVYSYTTSGLPQQIEEDDYDFGQTTSSRSTRIAYETFLGTPGVLADKPCKTVVYGASGKPTSETDYLYDSGSVICGNPGTPSVTSAGGSALTGHDQTNFAAGSPIGRGNLTAKIQRLTSGMSPTTLYTYDETGQITSMTDPNGNVTQYSYADQFVSTNTGSYTTTNGSPLPNTVTNAYLTKVTRPSTSTSHIQNYTYGYNDGEMTTSEDENLQPTTYRYNDLLGRFTETDYPDHGQTTLRYNDSAPSPSITTTKALTSTTNMVSVATDDGLGRIVQTQLTSDPEGTTTTVATYTGTGWVSTRSNPHRTGQSATDGTTTYTYDALGRTKIVSQPDGSSIHTAYATSCAPNPNAYGVTVTDEAGKSRTTCSDGLGRLVKVFEDPSGLNYETDYQYDALDNLLGVTQKGGGSQANWRMRTFVYDSLSRLRSATNPESGTLLYSYDPNGNLISKTDARGIQTTMQYDALNRLKSKSYNDGTPTAMFYYDMAPVLWGTGIQNTNGRLVEATTGITPEP